MIRVILADDEQKVCQLINKLIRWEELGMELVGTAADGVETLKLIEALHPDLVVTDIRMPGYDGIELISRARELKKDLEFVIISGYSHFSYAQAAIRFGVSDYILKPVNRELLNETLRRVKDKILARREEKEGDQQRLAFRREAEQQAREQLFTDLEQGFSPAGIPQVNERYHYAFAPGLFQLFQIRAAVRGRTNLSASYVRHFLELVYPVLVSLLERHGAAFCHEAALFRRGEAVTGILNYSPAQSERADQLLSFLLDQVREQGRALPDLEVFLVAGSPVGGAEELGTAFSGLEELFCERFLDPAKALCREMRPAASFDQDALYRPLSDRIGKALEMLDEQALFDTVQDLEKEDLRLGLNGAQTLRSVLNAYHIFSLSGVFHKGYQIGDREAGEQMFSHRARLTAGREDLFSLLSEICGGYIREAKKRLSEERIRPMQQAMQYMQDHFREDISLEDVSSAVGLSGSYFSTVFRKESGKTFLEYLTGIRMEEARRLLKEDRLTIEMVGRAVGLADYKRFARTFKKEVGISPGEYRSLYS